MEENKIIAYKGFDENLCCRGFRGNYSDYRHPCGRLKSRSYKRMCRRNANT